MSVSRLAGVTRIGVEQMGDIADRLADPRVLRLENLDTDIPPCAAALSVSHKAIDSDDANSYLPFLGSLELRKTCADMVSAQAGRAYDPESECVITAGGLSGILNVLLATLEPGDEVLMTDPVYSGLLNRVRLAGGVPRLMPLRPDTDGWRLDLDALGAIDTAKVRLVLVMNPSMPTGAVFNAEEWQAVADFCRRADCRVLHDAAMDRVLYDDRRPRHPAQIDGLAERVISVGSASKEYRMIGWRVGWVTGPAEIIADIARVSISNVVCQTGIAMRAVATAIQTDDDGIAAAARELQNRRDLLLDELQDYRVVRPHGGWSLLIDMSPLGMDGAEASRCLLERGLIAATPMVNWGGPGSARYLRLVYSNENCDRLRGIGERFHKALRA